MNLSHRFDSRSNFRRFSALWWTSVTVKMKLLTLFAQVCLASLTLVSCKRIRESIYEPLQGINFCFKRANGTHEMGCSSDLNGNVGVVHLILNRADIDWLIQQGPHEPYLGRFEFDSTCCKAALAMIEDYWDGTVTRKGSFCSFSKTPRCFPSPEIDLKSR